MYGKIENGIFMQAPSLLTLGNRIITNPSDKTLANAGYKPVSEQARQDKPGFVSKPIYTETETEIIKSWEYEPVQEETIEEEAPSESQRLDALEANQELIAELLMMLMGDL